MSVPLYNPTSYVGSPYPTTTMPPMNYPGTGLRSILPGRSVESSKDIALNEIPMDGSLSVFPRSDLSAIYVKKRNEKGAVDDYIFIPAPEDYDISTLENTPETANGQNILDILERLNTKVDALSDTVSTLKTNNQYKKNRDKNNQHTNQQTQKEGAEVNA